MGAIVHYRFGSVEMPDDYRDGDSPVGEYRGDDSYQHLHTLMAPWKLSRRTAIVRRRVMALLQRRAPIGRTQRPWTPSLPRRPHHILSHSQWRDQYSVKEAVLQTLPDASQPNMRRETPSTVSHDAV